MWLLEKPMSIDPLCKVYTGGVIATKTLKIYESYKRASMQHMNVAQEGMIPRQVCIASRHWNLITHTCHNFKDTDPISCHMLAEFRGTKKLPETMEHLYINPEGFMIVWKYLQTLVPLCSMLNWLGDEEKNPVLRAVGPPKSGRSVGTFFFFFINYWCKNDQKTQNFWKKLTFLQKFHEKIFWFIFNIFQIKF